MTRAAKLFCLLSASKENHENFKLFFFRWMWLFYGRGREFWIVFGRDREPDFNKKKILKILLNIFGIFQIFLAYKLYDIDSICTEEISLSINLFQANFCFNEWGIKTLFSRNVTNLKHIKLILLTNSSFYPKKAIQSLQNSWNWRCCR